GIHHARPELTATAPYEIAKRPMDSATRTTDLTIARRSIRFIRPPHFCTTTRYRWLSPSKNHYSPAALTTPTDELGKPFLCNTVPCGATDFVASRPYWRRRIGANLWRT